MIKDEQELCIFLRRVSITPPFAIKYCINGFVAVHLVKDVEHPDVYIPISCGRHFNFPVEEEYVIEALTQALYSLATHEVDERLKIDDKHVTQPHPRR